MTTAHADTVAAQKAAEAEAARKAAEAKTHPLSPEQKEAQDLADAVKKAADERSAAIAKADAEYQADVAAAAAKRKKALENIVSENYAECAWEATKDPADPLWNDVQVDYRGKLQTIADDVEAKGLISDPPTAFEVKVDELVKAAKEKAAKAHPHRPLTAAEVAAGKKRPLTAAEVNAERKFPQPFPHPQTAAEAAAEKKADDAKALAAKTAADAKAKDARK